MYKFTSDGVPHKEADIAEMEKELAEKILTTMQLSGI